jgi:hypothetical protein
MPRWAEVHEFASSINRRTKLSSSGLAPPVASESHWSMEAVPPPVIESGTIGCDGRDERDCVHQQHCQRRLSIVRYPLHPLEPLSLCPFRAAAAASRADSTLAYHTLAAVPTQVEQALGPEERWCSDSRSSTSSSSRLSGSNKHRSNQIAAEEAEEEGTALDFGEEETWQRMMKANGWGESSSSSCERPPPITALLLAAVFFATTTADIVYVWIYDR